MLILYDVAPVDADVLQYGALGLLLAVLGGLFVLGRAFVERIFDQMERAQKFSEEQVERSHIQNAGNLQAFIDQNKELIEVQVTTAEALGNILVSLREIEWRFKQKNGRE